MPAETARLVRPDARYSETFLDALAEYHRENQLTDLSVPDLRENLEGYIATLRRQEEPVWGAPDHVPQSTFWLVDGGQYVGRLSLRHTLSDPRWDDRGNIGYVIRPSVRRQGYGTAALRLGLLEARHVGLERVLITCDAANIGSRKIIEANGGTLERVVPVPSGERSTCHYWIDL